MPHFPALANASLERFNVPRPAVFPVLISSRPPVILKQLNDSAVAEWLARYRTSNNGRQDTATAGVRWEVDQEWFAAQTSRNMLRSRPARGRLYGNHLEQGCCPAAVVVYRQRRGFRCCGEKLHRLLPLRPVGGMTLEEAASRLPSNTTLFFVGDSMSEQQIVSILCHAWQSPGFSFVLQQCPGLRHRDPPFRLEYHGTSDSYEIQKDPDPNATSLTRAVCSEAMKYLFDDVGCSANSKEKLFFSAVVTGPDPSWQLRLVSVPWGPDLWRNCSSARSAPETAEARNSDIARLLHEAPAYFVYNGWQHGLPPLARLERYLASMWQRWPSVQIVLTEGILSHYPGGVYLPYGRFPEGSCLPISPQMRWETSQVVCSCDLEVRYGSARPPSLNRTLGQHSKGAATWRYLDVPTQKPVANGWLALFNDQLS